MEETATATAEKAPSYRYWVREATGDAAPPPVPRKLDPSSAANGNGNGNGNPPPLGSVWNQVSSPLEASLDVFDVGEGMVVALRQEISRIYDVPVMGNSGMLDQQSLVFMECAGASI